ncbi:hypothetical protein CJD36_004895 [Flavipsychrobacter stenotrophus]|uniref:Uncharacterized protein n=1 Tax=Flavipsychrobacter stenotrophus TaxID=2077091 RepID=A0A2S7T2A5_9BACT|nr:hypothetical protein CJD36_004895 [Flavipsychrobacter stenotrophus]
MYQYSIRFFWFPFFPVDYSKRAISATGSRCTFTIPFVYEIHSMYPLPNSTESFRPFLRISQNMNGEPDRKNVSIKRYNRCSVDGSTPAAVNPTSTKLTNIKEAIVAKVKYSGYGRGM